MYFVTIGVLLNIHDFVKLSPAVTLLYSFLGT